MKLVAHGAALVVSLLAVGIASAEVRLAQIFSNDMMLQRDVPVRVWGWADTGEVVSVTFAGASKETKADATGNWAVALPALKEGKGLEMLVKGKNQVVLKNLIMGDIWVCSGQSNMEMLLGGCLGAAEDIRGADLPDIRQIKFKRVSAGEPQTDALLETPWQVCSPRTAAGFTAAGFYFAREIQQQTGVPIGLIYTNWGGTRIEPWTPIEGLEIVPELSTALEAKKKLLVARRAQMATYLDQLDGWIKVSRANLKSDAALSPAPVLPTTPDGGWSGLYNAMIHPIVKFPIKGALWYQGEANGTQGETYHVKMRALIGGWRKQWGQGDFPFYFVQLANFQAPVEDPAGGNGWAKHREAQRKSLAIPNTGMAVIIDTVPLAQAPDIHPKNKFDVGTRLARWALARDYGKQIVPSGPLFKAAKVEGSKIRLAFEHTGAGLMVGKKDGRNPSSDDPGGKLKQFAIAGADKKWVWADAVIDKDSVVVSSPEVKEPVAVRYAFQMNPDGANLYNKDGLPASPFRTDDW
jgi:sialate O-acetylesterase